MLDKSGNICKCEQHSSLFCRGAVGLEKVYETGYSYKTFFVRDLQIFVLSQSVCCTRLKKLTKYKHSSLLRKTVIYGQKSFLALVPGRCEAANLLREEILNKRKADETLK